MKINQLIANNIKRLDVALPEDKSLGIAGLSGSGKTTFSQTIGEESKKRLVSLLPKAEYQYLFPSIMETNFSAIKMEEPSGEINTQELGDISEVRQGGGKTNKPRLLLTRQPQRASYDSLQHGTTGIVKQVDLVNDD